MPCILPVLPQQLGEKFDNDVKRSKIILGSSFEQTVDLAFPMLYTKILPQSFLGSGEGGFEVFLPYIDMAAILFNSAKPFDQIICTTFTEGPMRNLLKLEHSFREDI